MNNEKNRIGELIIDILIPLAGGLIIGFLITNSGQQYGQLIKPSFAPPSWIFRVVWPILYILMGISYNIYKHKTKSDNLKVNLLYYFQLIINFLWSFIFFRLKLYGISFLLAVFLAVLVGILFYKFFKTDKVSSLLLVPYLLWLIYASVLSYFIWMLNEM